MKSAPPHLTNHTSSPLVASFSVTLQSQHPLPAQVQHLLLHFIIMENHTLKSAPNAPHSQFIPCPTLNRRQHATTSAPAPPAQFNPKQRERLLKRRQAREDLLHLLRARPPVPRPILGPGCMRYPRGPDGRFLVRGRVKVQKDVQIEKIKPVAVVLEKLGTRSAVQVRSKL